MLCDQIIRKASQSAVTVVGGVLGPSMHAITLAKHADILTVEALDDSSRTVDPAKRSEQNYRIGSEERRTERKKSEKIEFCFVEIGAIWAASPLLIRWRPQDRCLGRLTGPG